MIGLVDVPGVRAGHWTHSSGTTGCTALVFPDGARGGVVVPGHAPGSRELGALAPTHLADALHGLVLSGGSAFGLATADGVMAALDARGIGLPVGRYRVPIVPAAILFDLGVAAVRPDAAAGRAAVDAAFGGAALAEGRVGAGAGATVGNAWGEPVPGGFGQSGARRGAFTIAVGVAVNAFGGVRDPDTGAWVAGGPAHDRARPGAGPSGAPFGQNTTLAVVVTDAPLPRAACTVLARMAAAGLARATDPAFTPFDGDTVFAVSTGGSSGVAPLDLMQLGRAAAAAVGRACVRGVTVGRG